MRALVHTEGMTTPERAEFWLQCLAKSKHRGRHDTWTAARDRAAKDAGLPLSMAKRIWNRWENMNDVGGKWLLRLMLAYEAMCEEHEAVAGAMKAERLELKAQRNAVDQKPVSAGERSAAARD